MYASSISGRFMNLYRLTNTICMHKSFKAYKHTYMSNVFSGKECDCFTNKVASIYIQWSFTIVAPATTTAKPGTNTDNIISAYLMDRSGWEECPCLDSHEFIMELF